MSTSKRLKGDIKKRILHSIMAGNQTFNKIWQNTRQEEEDRLEKKGPLSQTTLSKYLKEMVKKDEVLLKKEGKVYSITSDGIDYLFNGSLRNMFEEAKRFVKILKVCNNIKTQEEFKKALETRQETAIMAQIKWLKDYRSGEYAAIMKHTNWVEIIDKFPKFIIHKDNLVFEKVPVSKKNDAFSIEMPLSGENIYDKEGIKKLFVKYNFIINDPEKSSEEFKIQRVKDVENPLMDAFKESFASLLSLYGQVKNPQEMVETNYFVFGPGMQLLFNFDVRCLGDDSVEFSKNSKVFEEKLSDLRAFCSWRHMLSGDENRSIRKN